MNLGEYTASQANRFEFFVGVPIDATQTRQLYFSSAAERDAYFDAYPKGKYYATDNAKYIRRNGKLKAQIPPTTAVNYMRFKNTGSAINKWFYAFVNRIDYLNPTTSVITWTLDTYQTFIYECSFKECDISRETRNPNTSQNNFILPEGLDYGDYRILTIREVIDMSVTSYLVIATVDLHHSGTDRNGNPILQAFGGAIYNNAPSCCDMILCRTKEKFTALMNELTAYPWVAQCVQGVYGLPSFMLSGLITTNVKIGSGTYERVRNTADTTINVVDIGNILPISSNNGIMPDFKYRKLWQYPYTFFEIVTPDGTSQIFKPELFNQGFLSLKATVRSILNPEPNVFINLQNYDGQSDITAHSISANNFPMYPVPNNQYYAQQKTLNAQYALSRSQAAENLRIGAQYIDTNLMYGEAHNVVNLAGSAMGMLDPTSWVNGGITGHVQSAAHTAISAQEMYIQAQQQKETASRMEQQAAARDRLNMDQNQTAVTMAGRINAGAMPVLNAINFSKIYFRVWTITDDAANRLDKYFDSFGLKTNRIGTPQFYNGLRYHYIRMNFVNLYGDIPQDYLIELQNIFLDGITLWKDHENVGTYGDNFNG